MRTCVLNIAAVVLLLLASTGYASTTLWDEAVDGDMANNSSAPTALGALTLGDNLAFGRVSGCTGTADCGPEDQDFFGLTVPGHLLIERIVIEVERMPFGLGATSGEVKMTEPPYSGVILLHGDSFTLGCLIDCILTPIKATTFGLIVSGLTDTIDDAQEPYFNWSLTVTAIDNQDATSIPLAAGWPFLLSGLSVLMMIRRRGGIQRL